MSNGNDLTEEMAMLKAAREKGIVKKLGDVITAMTALAQEDEPKAQPGTLYVDGKMIGTVEAFKLDPPQKSNADLLSDLTEAAATLRKYETLHRAKGTIDSLAKAEVNAELAGRFETTIANHELTVCNVPPGGWYCTRVAGHEGPCAARPIMGPLGIILWLYRRLPRAYGRPQFIESVIEELAKEAGIDVTASLTERGAK